jgi:hypothetical protein
MITQRPIRERLLARKFIIFFYGFPAFAGIACPALAGTCNSLIDFYLDEDANPGMCILQHFYLLIVKADPGSANDECW